MQLETRFLRRRLIRSFQETVHAKRHRAGPPAVFAQWRQQQGEGVCCGRTAAENSPEYLLFGDIVYTHKSSATQLSTANRTVLLTASSAQPFLGYGNKTGFP